MEKIWRRCGEGVEKMWRRCVWSSRCEAGETDLLLEEANESNPVLEEANESNSFPMDDISQEANESSFSSPSTHAPDLGHRQVFRPEDTPPQMDEVYVGINPLIEQDSLPDTRKEGRDKGELDGNYWNQPISQKREPKKPSMVSQNLHKVQCMSYYIPTPKCTQHPPVSLEYRCMNLIELTMKDMDWAQALKGPDRQLVIEAYD